MKYVCSICGYIYDEAVSGPWAALPGDWKCPWCGADKAQFRAQTAPVQPAAAAEKPQVDRALSPWR